MLILKIKVIKTDIEKEKEKNSDMFALLKPELMVRVRVKSHLRLPRTFLELALRNVLGSLSIRNKLD